MHFGTFPPKFLIPPSVPFSIPQAGSEQGTQSSTGIMSTGKDTASPPAPLTLPTLPTGAGSLGNDGSLTGQQAGGVPWDVQARDFFDGGVHWARGHPYHAGAGLLLLYPAWLIAAASLRTVLTEFTPVLVMSALVALAATALSWFVLAGERDLRKLGGTLVEPGKNLVHRHLCALASADPSLHHLSLPITFFRRSSERSTLLATFWSPHSAFHLLVLPRRAAPSVGLHPQRTRPSKGIQRQHD